MYFNKNKNNENFVKTQFPPFSAAKSTMTDPGFMFLTACS